MFAAMFLVNESFKILCICMAHYVTFGSREGLLAYAFEKNCFRTLAATATDRSHRLTMEKCL